MNNVNTITVGKHYKSWKARQMTAWSINSKIR